MRDIVNTYVNRDLSWLDFNARVLQEAADQRVPIIDRLHFLGIFSNNLDEFFRVRYATIKRIQISGKDASSQLGGMQASPLMEMITKTVIDQQSESLKILDTISAELRLHNIFIINEEDITESQAVFLKQYYEQVVFPDLAIIMLEENHSMPILRNDAAYMAVRMLKASKLTQYALIEIQKSIDRFVVLPKVGDKEYVILIDDILRYFLKDIFKIFNFKSIEAHMIKITRDGELDIDSDLSKGFVRKLKDSLKDRELGDPVRFVYDKSISEDTLKFLMEKMGIDQMDSIIPGGRYHNRRDYTRFPGLGRKELRYPKINPLPIQAFEQGNSMFDVIKTQDKLIYSPYHSFSYIVKFLREAAIDPKVKYIKITIYRLAKNSQIASALINAAKNGKEVTACIELQARFDEQANIKAAEQMEANGVNVIFGVQGLKVHSKLCVIGRLEKNKIKRYGFVSTGNFNEFTALYYTDFTLLTAHRDILKDFEKVFNFFETSYKIYRYKHIITSPNHTQSKLYKLIDHEIEKSRAGKNALIKLKMNSFSNHKLVDKLYEASRAGVKIQMIVRGICCLVPGVKGMSENIEVISIVDRFLEHTRLFIFGEGDDELMYISSADWMTRNLENRIEVSCPIYDPEVKRRLNAVFNLCWTDNQKARVINNGEPNAYKLSGNAPIRSQMEAFELIENYL
ncbi:MAG: polyphosphate kinase 1 [Bacteroidetes bacterium]|nr:polyphosphate kinase 1 [Bacteroidota bacterium]MDA0879620.1 polyphosphate kinase 1 [Bacteroidota bacterium]MDA1115695.1 polyphosphate kinase 1 [Bacteroidota bacterium]